MSNRTIELLYWSCLLVSFSLHRAVWNDLWVSLPDGFRMTIGATQLLAAVAGYAFARIMCQQEARPTQ